MATYLVVDASSILHRCYHAINGSRPAEDRLDGGAGVKPEAVALASFRMVERIVTSHGLSQPLIAFEGRQTWRSALYPPYKAQRERSDILRACLAQATAHWQLAIEQRGNFWYHHPDHEADDTAATLAKLVEEASDFAVILSTDRDLLQCITQGTAVLLLKSAQHILYYDDQKFTGEYQFKPTSLPDYKALVGDTADNIPGVKGIGPVAATALIAQHGILEEVYENLWQNSTSLSVKLKLQRQEAFMFRQIATVDRNVPIDL